MLYESLTKISGNAPDNYLWSYSQKRNTWLFKNKNLLI